jgi:hypothetical protein
MCKLKCCFLGCSLLFLFSCSHGIAPQANFQAVPVVADGYAREWQLPLKHFNKTYKLSYDISYDNKNIYIAAYTTDWRMEKRVLKEGLTLYFDPRGGSSTKISLTYPSKKTDLDYLLKAADSITVLNTLVLQSDVYDAEGFLGIVNGPYEVLDSTSQIKIGLKATLDSGLFYEAIIPIDKVVPNGLSPKYRKDFSIGLAIHANESWKTPPSNGVKNNDNTASAFQNDKKGGGFGGGSGGKGGAGMFDGPRKYYRKGIYDEEEEVLWNQFSFPLK